MKKACMDFWRHIRLKKHTSTDIDVVDYGNIRVTSYPNGKSATTRRTNLMLRR
jgi:hypothetical protein